MIPVISVVIALGQQALHSTPRGTARSGRSAHQVTEHTFQQLFTFHLPLLPSRYSLALGLRILARLDSPLGDIDDTMSRILLHRTSL